MVTNPPPRAKSVVSVGGAADGEDGEAAGRFRIKVVVRFKPAGRHESAAARKVCLPLHQRQQMLKKANDNCSTSEAMRLLAIEGGYAATAGRGPWGGAAVLHKGASEEQGKENEEPAAPKGAVGEEGEGGRYQASVLSFSEAEGTVLTVAPGVGLRRRRNSTLFTGLHRSRARYTTPRPGAWSSTS